MPDNKKQMLHRQKLERRNRRQLARQHKRNTEEEPDVSLIREGARPSRQWTRFHTRTSQNFEVYCVAGRGDFRRTVDREALDATITAGLNLKHQHPPKIELSFAIVRRAQLYGGIPTAQLEEVLRWNRAGSRLSSEWNSEDVHLIQSTAAFLIRADNPLGPSDLVDLNWLQSVDDPYQRGEARLLLAQYYLESALPRPTTRRGLLSRLGTAVTSLQGGIHRGRKRKDSKQILEEILNDETYGCVTLPRSRVRLAQAWLAREDAGNALRALDPRRSAPAWPHSHNQDAQGTTLKVELVSHLVQEGAASTVKSRRRKAYTSALTIAKSISTPDLEPADALRLARSLDEVSRTDPESVRVASHLLFRMCPDPTRPSVTPELAQLMHDHYRTRYLSSPDIRYITNAYSYIDAAFKKLQNGSPEKLLAGRQWLRTSYTYTGATSLERQVSVFPVLDYMEEFLRRDDPKRIEYLSTMGMALSRAHKHGDHSDRLVGYWEEHLKLVQEAVRRAELSPQQLAKALESTAVSLRLRSRQQMNNLKDLARALDLSRQAFDLVGYSERLRTPLVYSRTLNEWSRIDGSPGARLEAIQIQTKALREARVRRNVGRAQTSHPSESRMDDLPDLLQMTFPVSRAESAECSDSLKWLHEQCLDDDYADLMTSLAWATDSCRFALASGDWDYPPKIASKALKRVEQTLTSVDNPDYALYYIQGLSSIGAVALTHKGAPAKAVAILERGAALRARIQLEPQRGKKTLTITDAQPADLSPPTPQRFESAHEIKGLATTLDGPIIYIAATDQTGLALVVTSDSYRFAWLPELTTINVDHWLDLTAADRSLREKSRGTPVRGAPGEDSPGRAAVDQVIAAATAAVAPLEVILSSGPRWMAHIIPVGQTAGIPWTYAFDRPVTINPSATLLNRSRRRPPSVGLRIAITAPNPCHFKNKSLPALEKARDEGTWLEEKVGFDNTATGPAATRNAFQKALNAGPEVLHIAAHGYVDTNSWGDVAHLLWADSPGTSTAETTALPEIRDLNAANVGTVFLAACWGGAPNRTLPDESISFPTAFLTAGAKSVIAPLWPIDDDVAYEFVMAFYEFWKLDGLAPTIALKRAAAEVRDAHPDSSTWAAFMLTGHI